MKYCQFNEESVIDQALNITGPGTKRCAEFGGADGLYNSNTARLIKHFQWSGTFIDKKKGSAEKVANNYPDADVTAVDSDVTVDNINTLLPDRLHLVSIDIDGNDYWIWKAMEQQPAIVIIEYNHKKEGEYIMDYDESYNWKTADDRDSYGASEESLTTLGRQLGYKLFGKTPSNLIFIRDEYFA